MHKLSQNLGKISKNQPKLEGGRFFWGAEYWTGEEAVLLLEKFIRRTSQGFALLR